MKKIKKFQNDLNTGNKRLHSNYNIFKELKECKTRNTGEFKRIKIIKKSKHLDLNNLIYVSLRIYC